MQSLQTQDIEKGQAESCNNARTTQAKESELGVRSAKTKDMFEP
jgi:hypothetical protein